MSLINQMLRDLEQQQANNSVNKSKLSSQIVKSRGKAKLLWFWLISLSSLIPGYYFYQTQQTQLNQLVDTAQLITGNFLPVTPVEQKADDTGVLAIKPQSIQVKESVPAISNVVVKSAPSENTQPAISPAVEKNKPLPTKPNSVAKDNVQVQKPIKHLVGAIPSKSDDRPAAIISNPSKIPSPHEQVLKLFQQAQQTSSINNARTNLDASLRLEPQFLPARELLLEKMLASQEPSYELMTFLDESLVWFPEHLLFIKSRAQLYIQEKNYNAAIALLERLNSNTISDPVYLALLAASYQHEQLLVPAKELYQRLCHLQAEKAENWLGLAITYDKLNQNQAAIEAYQQAFQKNTLKPQIMDYIKQRLSVLNQ